MRVTVRIPFPEANGLSKNRTKRIGKGRMFLSQEGRDARWILEGELRREMRGQTWKHNRLHVDILLIRSGLRRDAVNFIDEVCDAVEKVTGVNDSWYDASARWGMNKAEELVISVYQDDNAQHARICSKCHRVLPEEEFAQRTGGCRPCMRAYNKAAAARRRNLLRLSGGQHDQAGSGDLLAGKSPGGTDHQGADALPR